MNKFLILLTIVCGTFGALVMGGYKLFGIGGALGGFVLFVIAVKLAIRIVKQRFMMLGKALFESKSRVLRGARATVHSINSAPKVEDIEVNGNGKAPTRFYFVDVTISPPMASEPNCFACWDSSDLMLVSYDKTAPTFESGDSGDEDGKDCVIHEVIFAGDENDGEKTNGEQRLKLHVGVPDGLKKLKFQYYFETFGEVVVP